MSEHEPSEEPEFALVMPFVVCSSVGGPYDDESFVAGYDLGILDTLLKAGPTFLSRTMRTASGPQIDLLAMKHGYRAVQFVPDSGDEWVFVEFSR